MAIPSGFPNSGNTGVVAGTILTPYSGTLTVTQDGAVISGLHITGDVVINADNVTLLNCKIDGQSPWNAVIDPDGYTGLTVEHCEIDGHGAMQGISGAGTFLFNNIYHVNNGIDTYGPSLIEDNYIHDLSTATPSPHYDGIENNGASNVQIIHNTIENQFGQTSDVMLDNALGSLDHILVADNYLYGGGYNIFLDDRFTTNPVDDASIRIVNNIADGGYWGPFALYGNDPLEYNNSVNGTVIDGADLRPQGTAAADTLPGASTNDTISGYGANDQIYGAGGNDLLRGGGGRDLLDGGAGDDRLKGGGEADLLRGGLGNDRFVISDIAQSGLTAGTRDTIVDFEQGLDRVDLASTDADTTLDGNQTFAFIGAEAFHGIAGELRASTSSGTTVVSGDVNGDAIADFSIGLSATFSLTAADFIL